MSDSKKAISEFLRSFNGITQFHQDHITLMADAKGSKHNHQAWQGGYSDHISQCLGLADKLYDSLSSVSQLPFTKLSAMKVLYFHDIEKIWRYTTGLPEGFNKDEWYDSHLPIRYNVVFSNDERNALQYVHGENEDYSGTDRKMGPLGTFCHSIDTLSARLYSNKRFSEMQWNY